MNSNYEHTLKNISNVLFSKYFLYIFFPLVVFINLVLFPDLLNHQDIKLNDLSYLLPQIEIPKKIQEQKIESNNTANAIYQEPETYKKETCMEQSTGIDHQNKEANITGVQTTSSFNEQATNNSEVKIENKIVNIEQNTKSNDTTETKEMPTSTVENNNTSSVLDKYINTEIENPNINKPENSSISKNKNDTAIPSLDAKKDDSNKFLPNSESAEIKNPEQINNTNGATVNDNKQFENNTNTQTVVNQPNEIIANSETQTINNPNITSSIPKENLNNLIIDSNESGNFYRIIIFLIVLAFTTSMGLFIYSNFDSLKMAFNFGKNPNFREYINSGYELLQD